MLPWLLSKALVMSLLGTALAMTPLTKFVASSSFHMVLQPTFSELGLEAQSEISEAMAALLLSSSVGMPCGDESTTCVELQDVDVVIQDMELHQGHEQGQITKTIQLPSTTITFVILGTFAPSSSKAASRSTYLDTLIVETFSSVSMQSEFRDMVESIPALKDLVDIAVEPTLALTVPDTASSESSSQAALTIVDVVLVAVGALVLIGVAYMVYHNRKIGNMVQERNAAHQAWNPSDRNSWLSQDEEHSMVKLNRQRSSSLDMLSILKSNGAIANNSPQELGTTPEPTDEEESEPAMSDRHSETSEQSPVSSAEHLLVFEASSGSMSSKSSSSSEDMSQEGLSQLRSSDSSSSGSLNSTKQETSNESYSSRSHKEPNEEQETSSYASSGISSAHFSSRWFESAAKPNFATMSDDSQDIFHVDMNKSVKLLQDDSQSKSALVSSTTSLAEWARSICVIASDKESVATPDETYMTPCSHDSVSSSGDDIENKSCHEELDPTMNDPTVIDQDVLAI